MLEGPAPSAAFDSSSNSRLRFVRAFAFRIASLLCFGVRRPAPLLRSNQATRRSEIEPGWSFAGVSHEVFGLVCQPYGREIEKNSLFYFFQA
jgi:hypothetical protein